MIKFDLTIIHLNIVNIYASIFKKNKFMTVILVSYRMLCVFNFYEPGMSWEELFMMFILTFLIGTIVLALSNILVKFYPSLLKKNSILGGYSNERYTKQPHVFYKLIQVSVWKLFVFMLVLMFVLIQYYVLVFKDI